MRLRLKSNDGGMWSINVNSDCSWNEFCQVIETTTSKTGWLVKVGYPPILLENVSEEIKLKDLPINDNETILLEKANKSVSRDEYPLVFVKEIADDNSCLFNSIGYVLENHSLNKADSLRQLIAQTVLSDSTTFNPAFLGRSVEDYCDWILKKTSWGGGIELFIFSNHYKVEIASLDIQTLRMDIFGSGNGYAKRVYLLYNGIHYNAIAAKYTENAIEQYFVTIFNSQDDKIASKVYELAEVLHRSHNFTDLAKFKITCQICRKTFSGQKGAHTHALESGHLDFKEE